MNPDPEEPSPGNAARNRARRIYRAVRLSGYACGIAGALLTAWGRRGGAAARNAGGIGSVLLIAMFLLFVVSYGFALSGSLRGRTGTSRR